MSYWRGTHKLCGGTFSWDPDISAYEAYCENCGWLDLWEARNDVEPTK